MFVADLEGFTGVDGVVDLDDKLLAQEGSPSPAPGRAWRALASFHVDLEDACEWVISGTLEGDAATASLIEKSGAPRSRATELDRPHAGTAPGRA